ncbi:MAG: hypothetical protein ABI867_14640 [Kofleriaceae bacterium]
MNKDVMSSALAAVRAAGDEDSSEVAAATRVRLRRSLEGHAIRRHRAVRIGAVLAVLLVTSVSWALTTGRIQRLFAPAPEPDPVIAPVVAEAAPKRVVPPRQIVVTPEPVVPEVVAPVIEQPAPPVPPRVRPPTAIEILYRKAHDLHFHGGDHAAVLAAWDAYLAAEPSGRFAVEARYNRALMLARLGRYSEAHDALAPYARGEIANGYRKAEAQQLVERLAKIPLNDPR